MLELSNIRAKYVNDVTHMQICTFCVRTSEPAVPKGSWAATAPAVGHSKAIPARRLDPMASQASIC